MKRACQQNEGAERGQLDIKYIPDIQIVSSPLQKFSCISGGLRSEFEKHAVELERPHDIFIRNLCSLQVRGVQVCFTYLDLGLK